MKANICKSIVLIFGIFLFSSNSLNAQSDERRERREPPTFEELLKKMDKNEDGKLSKDEVKGPLKDRFAEIDINEDGFITEKEFEDAPKPKRREKRDN